jgi:hypothetical protein
MKNPYPNDPSKWVNVTTRLLAAFPLPMDKLVEVVLSSWEDIFHSRFGARAYEIGRDIYPEPQIMGFLLHELIPLNLAVAFPSRWRRGSAATECDAVCVTNADWSFEIKTSSSPAGIFGNRSYAHVSGRAGKLRGSFYLAVNFAKFAGEVRPEITLIRFGWLGPGDWLGQRTESGQRARLTKEAKAYKLRIIYEQSPSTK